MARGPRGLTPQKGLGKAIRLLREEAEVTQVALAHESDVSACWLSRIEHGEVDPTWATVNRLSKGLGVSMESVAERAEWFEQMDA
ncbi:MAG TPA: helix-turn-helix transcriptional regulator [Solirubrobacterales bacterium]|nr:helix-turn-helix transcriptional regulator [Solirubrobacterales bacterium]